MKYDNTISLLRPCFSSIVRPLLRKRLTNNTGYPANEGGTYRFSIYSPESLPSSVRNAVHDHAVTYLWSLLEAADLVRVRFPPDNDHPLADLKGDTYDLDCNSSVPGGARTLKAQEKAFEKRVEDEGVCGIVCEYRCSPSDKWTKQGSCWGFVGEDEARSSGYLEDLQSETIMALRLALKSRCPCCRKPK